MHELDCFFFLKVPLHIFKHKNLKVKPKILMEIPHEIL